METQQTTSTESCSACAYWKAGESNEGACRRQPPQSISFEVDDEVKFETRFPTTSADDWCGEFKAG
ncbi:MAG: hypothetical protein AAGF67_09370 [Verrucomicrobiota bacterium]